MIQKKIQNQREGKEVTHRFKLNLWPLISKEKRNENKRPAGSPVKLKKMKSATSKASGEPLKEIRVKNADQIQILDFEATQLNAAQILH